MFPEPKVAEGLVVCESTACMACEEQYLKGERGGESLIMRFIYWLIEIILPRRKAHVINNLSS